MIIDNLRKYEYVILDSALPKVKDIWELCDYTILIRAINDEERFNNLKSCQERIGSKQPLDLELRNAMSPNYSLFIYNQELIDTYDEQYYDNIVTLAKYLQKE